jgi:HK97 family phage portal protein
MLGNLFEKRAISFQTLWGAGDDFDLGSQAGPLINSETAFHINPVFSAISLISDTISTLPLDAYVREGSERRALRPRPAWVLKPDVDTTREAFYGSIIVSLLLDGNAFIRVFKQNNQIVNLVVLNPHHVEIRRNGLGRLMFELQGEKQPLSNDDIIFIPDVVRPGSIRGVSRVEALKDNFGLAKALETYAARFFGHGATTSGIIEYPHDLTFEQSQALAASFDAKHKGLRKSHKTGVLSGGATYRPTSVTNDQAQFLDSRRMAVEDVARAFNVPPHLLGLPGTNTFASVEQNNLAWVTHGLRPIISKIETGLSPLLALSANGQNAFLRFNIDGLLRADINTRMTAYSVGLQAGFLTINDVRRLEDLQAIENGSANTVRVPLANVDVEDANLTGMDKKVGMAQKLVISGFDPAQVLTALGLPAIEHTGVPSTQLQALAQLDPADPLSAYEVE